MDPISIGAGIVVVSYLVPLIISCVGGAVMIIVTALGVRWYYKKEGDKDKELAQSYKEQHNREKATRENISRVVAEAGIDLQTLLSLSNEQQKVFKLAISEFITHIQDSHQTTQKLNQVAESIQVVADKTTNQSELLSTELDIIKSELSNIYQKLKLTEAALSSREKELHETILKLRQAESINSERIQNDIHIQQFARQIDQVQHDELHTLLEKNTNLCATIETLNKTIIALHATLSKSDETNHRYLNEIQTLLANNKRLSETIDKLTRSIENDNRPNESAAYVHGYQPTLFK
ncbi:MAG: hypothetical protein Q8R83_00560 [Legionellaceae bacterium]|nr:hypothetical protein [Legionellaceae bacterium]